MMAEEGKMNQQEGIFEARIQVLEEKTHYLKIKLNRVIYAFVFLGVFSLLLGVQFFRMERCCPSVELTREKLVDQAHTLKVKIVKDSISKAKKLAEDTCIESPDDQCEANLNLKNAMKELAELNKYSDMNALLPGEIFRLLSIETSARQEEDKKLWTALSQETLERQKEDSIISSSLQKDDSDRIRCHTKSAPTNRPLGDLFSIGPGKLEFGSMPAGVIILPY